MKKFKVLILTDHVNHSKENSLYALARAMLSNAYTYKVDIASRGIAENEPFFSSVQESTLYVSQVTDEFSFAEDGAHFFAELVSANLEEYDLVWLRLPPPLSLPFIHFIEQVFQDQFVINRPSGIYQAGSKEFLLNFPEVCPPMKVCISKADIFSFKSQFPIVLKPFREYGGKGIVKIDGDRVWSGRKEMKFEDFIKSLDDGNTQYLGVKYLKNVTKGDKRIIVVNGKILGASLRLPPDDFWICNVSMGGSSHIAEIGKDELEIIKILNPVLAKMGIAMYGVDTLVNDRGERVLSEINTTSIGGLTQIAQFQKLPLVEEAVNLIWSYFINNKE